MINQHIARNIREERTKSGVRYYPEVVMSKKVWYWPWPIKIRHFIHRLNGYDSYFLSQIDTGRHSFPTAENAALVLQSTLSKHLLSLSH